LQGQSKGLWLLDMQKFLVLLAAAVFAGAFPAYAVRLSTLDKRLIRSAESFENVVGSRTGNIPPDLLRRAQGILILRNYEAGFWVGGKGGAGVAMARNAAGGWGDPVFFKAAEGSWGLQIGAHRLDMVLLFMERSALERLARGNFRVGVDAAAAAGPVGGNWEGKIGTPILIYSSSAGLYIGAKFEGGLMTADSAANDVYYQHPG
jgi:lipid-binding SYLF domain-containing protein